MYENLNDELYFGEVYRTVLQEAWLPEGAHPWQRTGISRRGRRPTQQGLYPSSPTQAQATIRQCFSSCASAWLALPWDTPTDPWCDTRLGKDYWFQEKLDRGLICSYYDLYIRSCLRYCFVNACIPPFNYLLSIQTDLQHITPSTLYDISFPNAHGPVSMISGFGQFISPDKWLSPPCFMEDTLCFQDDNLAKGSISYSFLDPIPCVNIFSETWADWICTNNLWYSEDDCCPSLPLTFTYPHGPGSISLSDGILHLEGWSQIFWGAPWDATYPVCEDLPIENPRYLITKLSAKAIPPEDPPSQPPAYAALIIRHDTPGHLVPFTLVFACSKPFDDTPTSKWFGDNEGHVQNIDLQSLGITGDIHKMQLRTYTPQATGYDCQMDIDYIFFRP